MKLRIQGDSLRLRMTQNEVAFLHSFGCVESTIRFEPGRGARTRACRIEIRLDACL
jgi:Family of unknown function (DUF7009)